MRYIEKLNAELQEAMKKGQYKKVARIAKRITDTVTKSSAAIKKKMKALDDEIDAVLGHSEEGE